MRTNRQQMETKEFRAPREEQDHVEPTPESVAQLRQQAQDKEQKNK